MGALLPISVHLRDQGPIIWLPPEYFILFVLPLKRLRTPYMRQAPHWFRCYLIPVVTQYFPTLSQRHPSLSFRCHLGKQRGPRLWSKMHQWRLLPNKAFIWILCFRMKWFTETLRIKHLAFHDRNTGNNLKLHRPFTWSQWTQPHQHLWPPTACLIGKCLGPWIFHMRH